MFPDGAPIQLNVKQKCQILAHFKTIRGSSTNETDITTKNVYIIFNNI
jgi:hypothetical protein